MLLFEICSECSNKCLLVNKTYKLCEQCNKERLNKITTVVKKTPKTVYYTKKEAGIKSQLSALKKNISQKAFEEQRYYCWGCGKSEGGLDRSHIISVRERKDLELVEQNINLLCRVCHIKWESGEIEKQSSLNCFEKDLEFIRNNDKKIYQKFLTKLSDIKK